jgi:hypothetical protein
MPTLWEWVSIASGVIGVLLGVVGIAFAIYQTHAIFTEPFAGKWF